MSAANGSALEKRLRSIPITGVMPDPAVTSSIFSGIGSGSTKSPSACASWTISPGWILRTRWLETTPSGIALTVMLMLRSARGPWVSE